MKVFFLSLGCDKNLSDSEHMIALLLQSGYEMTDLEEEADVIIVNTCCFIGDAKEESIAEILRLSEYKKNGRLKALIASGCLSERYSEELFRELPELDGALGISSWDKIVRVAEDALAGKKPQLFLDKDRLPLSPERVVTTGGHYAFLKISEGCSKHCTYCVIPKVRGAYRSYPQEYLLKEAEELVRGGTRELILVAQETTLYGTDLYGRKMLPELLLKLEAIPDLRWIRLMYCYPEELTDELISLMARSGKIVPYLDIPVQHASDRILKLMGRQTTRAEITERIRKLRERIPGITLRTTLITGFPGETEEDFLDLCDFVREMRFQRLGVFPYSREEGTAAAKMKPQVPIRIRKSRRDAIMRIQQEIAFSEAENCVGKTLDVMIEGRIADEPDVYVGRSAMDAPDVDGMVFIRTPFEFMSGDFVKVLVTAARDYDLIGEVTE